MGKILLTSNQNWDQSLRDVFKNASFVETVHVEQDYSYLTTYKKLNVDTENYYCEGQSYIAGAGTFFYKGQMGKCALQELLHDADSMTIPELRRNLIGSYVIILKCKDIVRIFVDETTTYFIYYYQNGQDYLVTNTYYHIQKLLKLPMNGYVLLEHMTRCSVGLKSPVESVYKLGADQILTIDLNAKTCSIEECPVNVYSYNFSSKEEFINCLYDHIMEIARIRAENIRRFQLFLTGGVDSRLQLASHLHNGEEIVASYWKGKDVITNGTEQDLEISKKLAEKCNLKFKQYDVSEDYADSLSDITENRCNKYGEFSGIYGGNKFWFDIFESIQDVEAIDFGCAGEILRELSNIDQAYHDGYTIGEFVSQIYDRGGLAKNIFSLPDFYRYVEDDFKSIHKNFDFNNLSKENCLQMFNRTRFTADNGINNLVNVFVYTFPLYFSKQIEDMINSIPYEWLNNSTVPIALIEKIDRRLLDVPIFSHHRTFFYQPHNSTIKKSLYYTVIDKLKPILVNTHIYSILYIKFAHKYIRPQSVANDDILKICLSKLHNSPTLKKACIGIQNITEWKGLDVSALGVIVAGLCVFDNAELIESDAL